MSIERLSQSALHRIETSAMVAREDLKILAGEEVGPPGSSWQDIAGTASLNLRMLAHYLDHCRTYGEDEAGRIAKVCAVALGLES